MGASALAVGGTAATTLFTQSASAIGCVAAGTTGLTAAEVVTGGTVTATSIDATGCDVGIYVGPTAASGVIIGGATAAAGVTVSGANDTGIFVDQAATVTIENDTVENNGVAPGAGLASFGGILLAGVSDSTVTSNTVTGNGGGGIFVNDNGPVNPGAPNAGPNAPVPSNERHGQQQHDLGELRVVRDRLRNPQLRRQHHRRHHHREHDHGAHRRLQVDWS